MNYCSNCGGHVVLRIPPGDDRQRFVCGSCATIHYENPKMVVGCIPEWKDEILLCRRAIDPGYGKWTLPAGYLENGETVMEGTRRETWEEAGARIGNLQPFALLNLSFISQVYLMFRASLLKADFAAGSESLEIRLFREEDIPWSQLAFTVIRETLKLYFEDRPAGIFPFHVHDIDPSFRFERE
ncbi:MAG: NUDIX hydrolase [Desulforhabdus sp.]|jgi:ADP-ribose pyrophosphatase YjhB (NUDIX family)|nr:NUDIX hydrolase [Desulforhabdus sp.]